MDSKAIAVLIIGVSIMVLIVSSVIGAPADVPIHAVSRGSAQVKVLALPYLPAVLASAARALPLGETMIGSPESGDTNCATAGEFGQGAARLFERDHCALIQPDNLPGAWKCQNKLVRDCVGDFPSIGPRPPYTPILERQMGRLREQGDLQVFG